MGQTADEIRDDIEGQRQALGDNLEQLERKVKQTMDWRAQFEQRPMMGMGIAFGAGLLLAALAPSGGDDKQSKTSQSGNYAYAYQPYATHTGDSGNGQSRSWQDTSRYSMSDQQPQHSQRSPEMNEISETLDNIKGALLGLGATRLRSFLAEAVPGFHQEYEQARKNRNASPSSRIETTPSSTSSGSMSSSGMSTGTTSSSGSMGSSARNAFEDDQSARLGSLDQQTPGLDQPSAATANAARAFNDTGERPTSRP